MKRIIIFTALIITAGCINPVKQEPAKKTDSPIHEYKIQFETYEGLINCDSIEYNAAEDALILHMTPCGEVIPEFKKYITERNFKITAR